VALLDAVLENCIFYISLMFEFSHSQGHSRRFGFGECPVNARFRTYRLIAAINAKGHKLPSGRGAQGPDLRSSN
jgi:hypothetical protein